MEGREGEREGGERERERGGEREREGGGFACSDGFRQCCDITPATRRQRCHLLTDVSTAAITG